MKDHNSVTILRKITGNTLNLDLVNSNAHTKFRQILSIESQAGERAHRLAVGLTFYYLIIVLAKYLLLRL